MQRRRPRVIHFGMSLCIYISAAENLREKDAVYARRWEPHEPDSSVNCSLQTLDVFFPASELLELGCLRNGSLTLIGGALFCRAHNLLKLVIIIAGTMP
jgi:hypothetical protein